MKEQKPIKTKILQYVITFGACLLLCFIYVAIAGIFKDWQTVVNDTGWKITNEQSKAFFLLSNATFVIGVVCACSGLLVLAANGGAFEMFAYGIRKFITLFKKDPAKVRFKTFYDYHVYRSEQPKQSYFFLILVGFLYIGISVIFVFVYLSVL